MRRIADKEQKCLQIEALIGQGRGVVESCREVGMSEKTFQRWRKARLQCPIQTGRTGRTT